MTIRITQFMRDRRPNFFSIERLYEDVRFALSADCEAVEWVCRNPSQGIWPRLRDAWAARSAQRDVNHVTGDTHYLTFFLERRRTVLTVLDLVSMERSKGLKRLAAWFFWFWLPVMRSRVVITISETTRQALLSAVRCRPDKVITIHCPVSAEFQPVPKAFNADCPRILQVGTKPNKNLPRVAAALAGIRCKLVIIGPLCRELEATLATHGIDYENHVGLSREALLDQYIQADLLMFASTYEGFGLPVVEANAIGRPVVTSNMPPMTEVAQGAACLVDPHDVNAIRAGVEQIIAEPAYRDSLVTTGLRNAQRFRPAAIAQQYAAIYRQVAR